MTISRETSLQELAVIVSRALQAGGIPGASRPLCPVALPLSIYARDEYQTKDLDFATSTTNAAVEDVIRQIGFRRTVVQRLFEHPDTDWLVEFPPGPLGFGDLVVRDEEIPELTTEYGRLRVITPTLCVLVRP